MATHGRRGRLTFALVLLAAASVALPVAGTLGAAAPPTTLPPTTAPATTAPATTAPAPTTAAAAATTTPTTAAPTTTTLPPDRTVQRVPSPVPDVKIRGVSIPARRLGTAVGVAIVALALAGFVYGRLASRRRPLPPPTPVSAAPSEPARPLPPPLPPAP